MGQSKIIVVLEMYHCIMERVKRVIGNEIALGIQIPTIKSRASNIPMTKGTMYVVMRFDQ